MPEVGDGRVAWLTRGDDRAQEGERGGAVAMERTARDLVVVLLLMQ